MNYVSTIEPSI